MFGLQLTSAVALPGVATTPAGDGVHIRLARAAEIDERWQPAGARVGWRAADIEGTPFVHWRGTSGDHRFEHGDRATFYLSSDLRTLLCAPREPATRAWQRVLLDSVLLTVALLAGHEALHASAVAVAGRAVAIAAPPGGGKTTLAVELLRRGHALVADDVVVLANGPGGIRVHPGPPVLNVARDRLSPSVGTVLETFGTEAWVQSHRPAKEPLPLGALIELTSTGGGGARAKPKDPTLEELATLLLGFDDPADRRARRLELLAEMATKVPFVRLETGDDPPARSADVVEDLAGMPAKSA